MEESRIIAMRIVELESQKTDKTYDEVKRIDRSIEMLYQELDKFDQERLNWKERAQKEAIRTN